ncbi:MAG: HU family DNA-binding protein [Prevotella sp.]|nr:HU family DNA-binding protein [Prevotella sp.]
MSTMKDLARIVAEKQGITRAESEQFVAAMFELLKSTLNTDDQVKVKGLGTFKIQTVKSRSSINVNTGERVVIDSHDRIAFTPDKAMAESVNKPFGHFETVVLNDGVVFDDMEDAPDAVDNTGVQPVEDPVQEEAVAVTEPQPVKPDEEVEQEAVQIHAPLETAYTAHEQSEDAPVADIIDEQVEETSAVQEPQPLETVPAIQVPQEDAGVQEELYSEEDEDMVEEKGKGNRVMYLLFGIFLVVFFVAGFFMGRMTMDNTVKTEASVKKVVRKKVVKVFPKPVVAKDIDTVKTERLETKIAEQQHVKQPAKDKEESSATTYDSDPRIRTGAYRITGIDRTVTVSKGQTLEGISKTYLGPGMECYVEAVNGGIKDVKEGQKIKIPALKVKKKKAM